MLVVCTGSEYSGWQSLVEHTGSSANKQLTAAAKKLVLQQHTPGPLDRLAAEPFAAEIDQINQLGSAKNHIWADGNAALLLRALEPNAQDLHYLLFYSSLPQELANAFASAPVSPDPTDVRANWLCSMREIYLHFCRHRTKCTLVSLPNLHALPHTQQTSLLHPLGLAPKQLSQTPPNQDSYPALSQLIAESMLGIDDDCEEIYDQICSVASDLDNSRLSSAAGLTANNSKLAVAELRRIVENNQRALNLALRSEQLGVQNQELRIQVDNLLESARQREAEWQQLLAYLDIDPALKLNRELHAAKGGTNR